MPIFSERLKSRRERLDWSREELAEKAKVSPRSVFDWEGGKTIPGMEPLQRLSEALGVSEAWLFGGPHEHEAEAKLNDGGRQYSTIPGGVPGWAEDLVARLVHLPEVQRKRAVQAVHLMLDVMIAHPQQPPEIQVPLVSSAPASSVGMPSAGAVASAARLAEESMKKRAAGGTSGHTPAKDAGGKPKTSR